MVKITDVKVAFLPSDFRTWVFVKVKTDEPSLFGWGEATLKWKAHSGTEVLRALFGNLTKRHFWRSGIIGERQDWAVASRVDRTSHSRKCLGPRRIHCGLVGYL